MAINPHNRKPLKVLSALAAVTLGLYGLLFAATTWGDAQWQPKLGLDLEGGTQIVLEPVLVGNAKVTNDQLNQARDIIVQRVDANGVAGAEVTTRNGADIVVSIPGTPDKATEDAIRKSSQMRFRPVLAAAPGVNQPAPTGTRHAAPPPGTATGTATPARRPAGRATATGAATTAKSAPARRVRQGAPPPPTPSRDRHGHGAPRPAPRRHGHDRRAQGRQRPRLDHPRVAAAVPGARLLQRRRRSTRSSTTRPSRW